MKVLPKTWVFQNFTGLKTENFEISRYTFCRMCCFTSMLFSVWFALKPYFWRISKHCADFGQNWREVAPQKRRLLKLFPPDFDQI